MTEDNKAYERSEYAENYGDECDNDIAVDAPQGSTAAGIESNQDVCEQCGSSNIEDGYLLNLCTNCRNELSRFRVPLWVKGFAILVIAVLIAALMKFPGALDIGVSYEKAIKYQAENKYMSAMREYEKAAAAYPDSTDALCRLFIAQYRAGKVDSAINTYDKLVGRNVEDEVLFSEVTDVFNQIDTYYFPLEEFESLMNTMKDYGVEQITAGIQDYVDKNPDDIFAKLYLVNSLMENGEPEKAISTAVNVLDQYPDFVDCSFLLGAIYRETGQYDEAISLYNKLLESNIERADAYSGIARIELKRGNDEPGLDMAMKAYAIDNSDSFVISNLILAYHFNNMTAERDKAFDVFKQQENYSERDYELLTSIISGANNNWRD